ncbi:hypothetical protein Hanom_Chr05g00438411 [Helianthus anomalus]
MIDVRNSTRMHICIIHLLAGSECCNIPYRCKLKIRSGVHRVQVFFLPFQLVILTANVKYILSYQVFLCSFAVISHQR